MKKELGTEIISKIVFIILGITFCYILFSVAVLFDRLPFYATHYYILPNWIMLIMAIIFFVLSVVLLRKIKIKSLPFHGILWEIAAFLFLFILQLLIAINSYSRLGWDPQVLLETAYMYDLGYTVDFSYFSSYPNNILLLKFFIFIVHICNLNGIAPIGNAILCIVIINCLVNLCTAVLTFSLIEEMCDKRTAWIGLLLYTLLVGTSGWLGVYYTDSLALIFPVLMLFLWIKKREKKIIYLLIGFIAIFGYYLKPQIMITFIAIFVFELVELIFKFNRKRVIAFLLMAAGFFFGFILVKLLLINDFNLDKEAGFTMSHYFMMGLSGIGNYDYDDYLYTSSFATKEARNSACWQMGIARIREMGFKGLCDHVNVKTIYNFHDGTFGFGRSDNFWLEDHLCNNKFSEIITNIIRGGGKLNFITEVIRQVVWLEMLLLTGTVGVIKCFRMKGEKSIQFSCIGLSIVGMTAFITIFEAQARYLYAYAPLFIIFAMAAFYMEEQ